MAALAPGFRSLAGIRIRQFFACAASWLAGVNLAAQNTYTPFEIGTLGGNYSEAIGINNSGQIIGNSLRADGRVHAFLQNGTVMTDLGVLAGDVESVAIAINNRGEIVGTSRSARGIDRGFLYRNGTLAEIVATPAAYSMLPRDINDAGQVVGNWRPASNPDFLGPFLYVDGRFTDLGMLGGVSRGSVDGINNAGVIIGSTSTARPDLAGFIAQPDGTITNLGSVGGRGAYPFAIADNGNALVVTVNIGGEIQMYRYENGRITPFGREGTFELSLRPRAMNNAGLVVGTLRAGFGQPQAALFTESDPINLNTRIPAGSFGRLTDANGINDSGAIVGRFERADSSARGFLLLPPAAGSPTLRTAPATQSARSGASATFAVTVDGNPPFTYQWLRNRIALPGATQATLNFPSAQPGDSGVYSVRVTNAAGSVLSPGAVLAVDAPVLTFIDLGTLGGDTSEVAAINSRGVVVGNSTLRPGVGHAFAFDARMTDLGTLGGERSAATQINDAGDIVGWAETRDGAPHAFLHQNGRMSDLGTLPGMTSSHAYAVDSAGMIVGQSAAGFRTERAVLWSGGQIQDLNTRFAVPAGQVLANARAIAGDGTITGLMYVDGDPVAHVFLSRGTRIVDLGRLGGELFSQIQLTGSNEAGQFTGISRGAGGFLYTPATATLTAFGTTITAFDVNARGEVVGGQSTPSGQVQAYWRVGERMINLNDIALVEGDRPLGVAKAINDQGWIAGEAFTQALSSRGFLLRATTVARASNLSVRVALAATRPLVVGFLKRGSMQVLLRAIGPGLRPFFGDSTALAGDPRLEVFDAGGRRVAENDNWDGSESFRRVFASVGAFPLPAASNDAALFIAPDGPVTAHANTGSDGINLVEVYAVDAAVDAGFINMSARYRVGAGEEVLVAGLVVGPGAPKTFLVRGVGPSLAGFGVTGVLADPVLEVFNQAGVRIDRNDDWPAAIAPIARQVGAFELAPESRDAALVVTLGPGNYSAQLSGKGGDTGEGLIEIYDLSP